MLPEYLIAALVGVLAHHAVFKKGEWHMSAPTVFGCYVIVCAVLNLAEIFLKGLQYRNPIPWRAFIFTATFTGSIFASIAVYRVFFHRLRQFPGPPVAGITKLWHSIKCLDSKNHLLLHGLHQKYGDFVRTGPAEVTVFSPEVLAKLDGPGSKCTKSVWYDFLLPHVGVTTIRNQPFHDQRRRVWTKGMSTSEMVVYEGHIVSQVKKLEGIISEGAEKGESINFSTYSYFFSFDVMGLFVFSRSFDMLTAEKWHSSITTLRRAMKILGPLSPVPWLAQIGLRWLRGYWVIKDWHAMVKWCEDRMVEHKDKTTHDIASYLLLDSKKRNSIETDHNLLTGDAIVAIIAGSDTVAPTMVFLFYELLSHPELANKLCEELDGVDYTDPKALRSLPYLNAVIKETLRLHPAVPTGGYRDTPPEGMTIGGTYIPGNTTVVAPRYILQRLPSCYTHAEKWIPERWTSAPELVLDSRSFLPFAQGRYTCLGKELAMTEMRMVTACLVSKYHISVAPGTNPGLVEEDMRDQFTATPGALHLKFTPRQNNA
ncbi:hypothetical protein FQN57_001103 [Myotisia sp. PD_48]|nr:hypothetical protein FQN57_001103 [Myotisia sp. PD_48]